MVLVVLSKSSLVKVRKNLFGKYTELMQLFLEMKNEIDSLKENKGRIEI